MNTQSFRHYIRFKNGVLAGRFGEGNVAVGRVVAALSTITMIVMGLSMYLRIIKFGGEGQNYNSVYNLMFYYQKATLVPNYFDLGFVRRGLAGTVAKLLSHDFHAAGIRLHIVSLTCLAIAWGALMLQLGHRLRVAALVYVAAIVALSPQTFRGWAVDIARSDMLVVGLVSWAVVATLRGHRISGILLVQCAQLAHEIGAIFGYPLLLVLNAHALQAGLLPRRDIWRLLGLAMIGSIAIIALQALYGPSAASVGTYIFRTVPPSPNPTFSADRDMVAYALIGGIRSVRAAICVNLQLNRQYFITVAVGIVTISAYAFVFGLHRHILAVVITSVIPFIFMSLIAIDIGRWIKIGVANLWLLAAGMTILGTGGMILTRRVMIIGCCIMAPLFALGPTTIIDASYGIRTGLARLGVPYPESFDKELDVCDPSWRTLLPRQPEPDTSQPAP